MDRAKEVVDGLHGIEGVGRNLDEAGIPVGHGTIPEPGALESLERLTVAALVRDETGTLVDKSGEVKGVAAEVPRAADQVHGIEEPTLAELSLRLRVIVVDLGALQDL